MCATCYSRPHETVQDTAIWRASSGANAVRQRVREGWRCLEFEYVLENQTVVWFMPNFGVSLDGDVMSYLFLGRLNVPAWFAVIDDEQYYRYSIVVNELQAYLNDVMTSQSPSRRLVRHVQVFDCTDMGLQHFSLRAFRRLAPSMALGDLYYPEVRASPLNGFFT